MNTILKSIIHKIIAIVRINVHSEVSFWTKLALTPEKHADISKSSI